MFDLRYHITSLTAVFLALGVGILIGIIMVDDDTLINEQKHLIDKLENDFQLLRQENYLARMEIAEYRNTLKIWEKFADNIMSSMIQGRLEKRRLALIQTNGQELPGGLVENLEAAGAEIVYTVNLATLFQSRGETMAMSQNSDSGVMVDLVAEIDRVASEIAAATGGGEEEAPGLDAVILIGGADSKQNFFPDELDVPLISRLRNGGITVAGVEVMGKEYSYIPYYRGNADIIIDNINTVPGQVALIWALSGFPGYYGTGPEALSLLPEPVGN